MSFEKHEDIKKLISSYYDGELSEEQKKLVEEHLKECPECRTELEGMSKLEEVMSKVEFKKPPKDTWEFFWTSVYSRLERNFGWILLSIGAMILLFFGGYKIVESIIQDSDIPVFLKVGILAFLGGIVVLLVSVIRERLFVRKRERYKEVKK